jgi:hypothetical protein
LSSYLELVRMADRKTSAITPSRLSDPNARAKRYTELLHSLRDLSSTQKHK